MLTRGDNLSRTKLRDLRGRGREGEARRHLLVRGKQSSGWYGVLGTWYLLEWPNVAKLLLQFLKVGGRAGGWLKCWVTRRRRRVEHVQLGRR